MPPPIHLCSMSARVGVSLETAVTNAAAAKGIKATLASSFSLGHTESSYTSSPRIHYDPLNHPLILVPKSLAQGIFGKHCSRKS
jgi:hypothetical protein